jgi:hypothetical protein
VHGTQSLLHCRGGETAGRKQQPKVSKSAVQSVTITDTMTLRQLTQELRMSLPEMEEKLANIGEAVLSSEDTCASALLLPCTTFRGSVPVLS